MIKGLVETLALNFFERRIVLEGYFPVYEYARITGLKKDTVHHRIIRGTVKSIMDDGRYFVYYSDNRNIPEGYITLEEYAKNVNKTIGTIRTAIQHRRISREYIKVIKTFVCDDNTVRKRIFIDKNAPWPEKKRRRNPNKIITPSGYLTVLEFAEKNGVSRTYIYTLIRNNKIPYIRKERFWYIPQTVEYKRHKRGNL